MAIVTGYNHTIFHYNGLVIKIKIPRFQLDILPFKDITPIIIDSIEATLGGIILSISSKNYVLKLNEYKPCFGINLIEWWNVYKAKRSEELLNLLKDKHETVTSIIKNEEALYLSVEPLSSFLTSSEYSRDLQKIRANIFSNDEYQEYRKTVHYSNTYRKLAEVNGDVSHLSSSSRKNKFAAYPRLYREKKTMCDAGHSFINYGTHLESFKKKLITKSTNRLKKDQIFGSPNNIENRKKADELKSDSEKNYERYYVDQLPITLIVDSIIIV